jgi:hypothetical protein
LENEEEWLIVIEAEQSEKGTDGGGKIPAASEFGRAKSAGRF